MPGKFHKYFRRNGYSRRRGFDAALSPTVASILRSSAFARYDNGLPDNFTDSDGKLLINHNEFWRRSEVAAGFLGPETETTIASNRVTTTAGTQIVRSYRIPPETLNYYVESTFYVNVADSGEFQTFARFRDARVPDGTGPTFIAARFYTDGADAIVNINLWNAGTGYAQTSNVTVANPSVGTTHKLGLRVEGDTYTAYYDGLQIVQVTIPRVNAGDTAQWLAQTGYVGFAHSGDGGSGVPFQADSFRATGLGMTGELVAFAGLSLGHTANLIANQKPMVIKRTALEFSQDPDEDAFSYSAGELNSVSSGKWTKNTDLSATPLVNVSSAGRIFSNPGSTTSTVQAYRLATPPPYRADYAVEADLRVVALPTAGSFSTALSARQQSASTSRYRMMINITSTGALNAYLYQTNSALQIRSNLKTGVSAGTVYRLRLQVNGTSIKGFIDDEEVLTATNATITGAGAAGVEFTNSTGTDTPSDSNLLQLDNFRVTNSKGQSIAIHSGWSIAGATAVSFGHSATLVKQPKKVTQALLTNGSSETLGTSFTTASVTLHANKLGLLTLYSNSQNSGQNAVPSSVVMNGTLNFTLVNNVVAETNWGRLATYRAVSATDITGTVAITYANNQETLIWELSEYECDSSGVNGANAIVRSAVTGPSTSVSSLTNTLPSVDSTNNAVFSAATAAYTTPQNPTFTAEAGWTEISDREQDETAGWTVAMHTVWRDNGDDLTSTHTIAITSASSGGLIIELKAPVEGAISGSTALTVGQSGTLRGTGVIADTEALTFGQSGTLRGVGAIADTEALTFSQSGALSGVAALAATNALAFGQSGTLNGTGLAGTTTLFSIAQSGELVGAGALVSAEALSFNQSGALVVVIDGTTAVIFGHSATLTSEAQGAISATVALNISQSGDLKGTGEIAATTSLNIGQTGELNGAGELSATSALSFGQSAAPSAIGVATASASLSIDQTSDITAVAVGTASSPLVFSSASTLDGVVVTGATTTLQIAQAGSLAGSGALSSATTLQIAQTATLEARGTLAATSGAAVSASGLAGALAEIAGTASGAFGAAATLAAVSGIDGQTGLSTSASAQLLAVGLLNAVSPVQFSQNVTLIGGAFVAGSAGASFAETATLGAVYPLAGSLSMQFGQSASVNAISQLAGTLQTSLGATAALVAYGNISASTALQIQSTASTSAVAWIIGTANLFSVTAGVAIDISPIDGATTFTFAMQGAMVNAVYLPPTNGRFIVVERARRYITVNAQQRYIEAPKRTTRFITVNKRSAA